MKAKPLPVAYADKHEYIAKEMAQALYQRRKDLLGAVGDRPVGGEKVSPREVRGRFNEMRSDPAQWAEVLQQVMRVKEDGRILLPKKLLEEVLKYEGELREGTMF